jgi:uncharacterized membrane protein YcaP (DUF421 family)
MTGVLAYISKGIIVFIFTYLFLRTISNKSMVHMASYEIAGFMIFSNVAAQPFLTESLPTTIIGLGVLIILTVALGKLSLINKLTPILEDIPTIIINNGQIDMKALRKISFSLNELLGLLRQQGYDSIRDIDYAILEPQGQLSVFPKSEKRPVTIKDMNLPKGVSGITVPLIVDGNIIYVNLNHVNYNKDRLIKELKNKGINNTKDVSLAELEPSGNLVIFKKNTIYTY